MKTNIKYTLTMIIVFISLIIYSCKKEKEEGTIIDADGNVYTSVTIGTQVWMVENLKTTKYNDYTPIPYVTDNSEWAGLTSNAYCWYDNDEATYKGTYGALYNWYTVNTGKLCPSGWHVPTDADWKNMEIYLGMTQVQADSIDWRGTDQGDKLKESGNTHWDNINSGTNSSGFTALPGGYRYVVVGNFDMSGLAGYWWNSDINSDTYPFFRSLLCTKSNILRGGTFETFGFSVRCIKDK